MNQRSLEKLIKQKIRLQLTSIFIVLSSSQINASLAYSVSRDWVLVPHFHSGNNYPTAAAVVGVVVAYSEEDLLAAYTDSCRRDLVVAFHRAAEGIVVDGVAGVLVAVAAVVGSKCANCSSHNHFHSPLEAQATGYFDCCCYYYSTATDFQETFEAPEAVDEDIWVLQMDFEPGSVCSWAPSLASSAAAWDLRESASGSIVSSPFSPLSLLRRPRIPCIPVAVQCHDPSWHRCP